MILNSILVLYIIPVILTASHYTILKITDKYSGVQYYTKIKLTYKQMMIICVIPVVNFVIAVLLTLTALFQVINKIKLINKGY